MSKLYDLVLNELKKLLAKKIFGVAIVGGIKGFIFNQVFRILADYIVIPLAKILKRKSIIVIERKELEFRLDQLRNTDERKKFLDIASKL